MGIYVDGKPVGGSASGGGGGTSSMYEHLQAVALADWPVEHLLGTQSLHISVWEGPQVDGSYNPVDFDSYTPVDDDNIVIHFLDTQTGFARISS